jgi:small subunit ribosomal protein S3Ae
MADKAKSSRIIDTWKQKKWYRVVAPQQFGSRQLGETMALEEDMLRGRTVKVSLSLVTGDAKKQSTNAIFEIKEVKNGVAETVLKAMEIAPSSIRRLVRKGKNRIDLSFICATKDGVVCRIKPFVVTRSKVGGLLLTKMRKLLEDVVRVEAHKETFDNFVYDVITGKVQRAIKQRLNKIYPLKICEVRVLEKTVTTKPLPPIPTLPELTEETVEETEEEKIEKKVKAKKAVDEVAEEVVEKEEKKPRAKKVKAEA